MQISGHYAYVHAKPDGSVFYVGKGSGRRYRPVCARSKAYMQVVSEHGVGNILYGVLPCSSEDIAYELERGLVKCFKRMGVQLVNNSIGGRGQQGRTLSAAQKEKISAAMKKVDKSYMKTPEYRAALSAALKGRVVSEYECMQRSDAMRNRFADPNNREAHSKAMKVSHSRPEVIEKMSGSAKARHARKVCK